MYHNTSKNKKEFSKNRNDLKSSIEIICNENDDFNDPLLNVFMILKEIFYLILKIKKLKSKDYLKQKKINDVEKEINENIEKELETFKTKFNEGFKEFTEDVEKCFYEATNILNELNKKSDTIISLKYPKDKKGLIKNDYNSLKNNLIQEIETTFY